MRSSDHLFLPSSGLPHWTKTVWNFAFNSGLNSASRKTGISTPPQKNRFFKTSIFQLRHSFRNAAVPAKWPKALFQTRHTCQSGSGLFLHLLRNENHWDNEPVSIPCMQQNEPHEQDIGFYHDFADQFSCSANLPWKIIKIASKEAHQQISFSVPAVGNYQ